MLNGQWYMSFQFVACGSFLHKSHYMSNSKLCMLIDMHFCVCKFMLVICQKLAKILSKLHTTSKHVLKNQMKLLGPSLPTSQTLRQFQDLKQVYVHGTHCTESPNWPMQSQLGPPILIGLAKNPIFYSLTPLFVYGNLSIKRKKSDDFVLILINSKFETKPMVSSPLLYKQLRHYMQIVYVNKNLHNSSMLKNVCVEQRYK